MREFLLVPNPESRSRKSGLDTRDSGFNNWSRIPSPEIPGMGISPDWVTLAQDNFSKNHYSAIPNKRASWNNRVGYYIGLFGYNIKNYFLFNEIFWKNSEKNNRACTLIRDCRVWPNILKREARYHQNKQTYFHHFDVFGLILSQSMGEK